MRRSAPYALALLLFAALTVFKTFPLVRDAGDHIPSNAGDPLLVAWILAWDTHALATAPLSLFDANTFYPIDRSLAFSEHLLGVVPFFAPTYALTGNAILAYNVLFMVSFLASAFAAFCLAYRWTGAAWPSLVAGTAFGFSAFRFSRVGHLHVINFFYAPLALLFLDRFLTTKRWRDLALCGLFYGLQCLSSVYLAFMMTVALVIYAAYYIAAVDRGLLTRAMLGRAVAFVAVTGAVLGPVHVPYFQVSSA